MKVDYSQKCEKCGKTCSSFTPKDWTCLNLSCPTGIRSIEQSEPWPESGRPSAAGIPSGTPPALGGSKYDGGKADLSLLSSSWVYGVGQVLTFGKRKYAAHNWRKGIALSRLLSACLRHVFSFLGGEDKDPETGLCHLYHASCCLMFAAEMFEMRPEMDDRYKSPQSAAYAPGE